MAQFKPHPDIVVPEPGMKYDSTKLYYKNNYNKIIRDIEAGVFKDIGNIKGGTAYRHLVQTDLFFLVYFVLKVNVANGPFVVRACQEVERGDASKTVELWAREHFKTTIITTAETIQKILKNPEERVGLFSHTRPIAKGFLRGIKMAFETSELLKECFSDVLYADPQGQSPKWSEDDGLVVKRKGFYRESTLEAWGLMEGMPTSKHFTHRLYDDIETADVVSNPDIIKKLIDRFDLSQNLGTSDGTERVVGTTYHHAGVLQYIRKKTDIHGKRLYVTRTKPATVDGTPNGKPVWLSQAKLDELKANEYIFNCQQLLNPTPLGVRKLDSSQIKEIDPDKIPQDVYKFMVIDSAGDDTTGKGDAWAILCFGVEPKADEVGASNIYLLDAVISPLRQSEAIEEITRMYIRNGIILQVGVEKVGLSTTEIHVANSLAKRGRHISLDNGTLILLRPGGREKKQRIDSALAWPLDNGKFHVSTSVPFVYRERLKTEMDKFPYWHDDGIDASSYLYDIMKDYNFVYYQDYDIPEYEPVNTMVGY